MDYEQMRAVLDELAEGLPAGIFERLNGGILLSPEEQLHPESRSPALYVAGKYVYDPAGLGRYIVLYYGSLRRILRGLPYEQQVARLKEVLYHELTHHVEHLAGERALEQEDQRGLRGYLERSE